MDTGPEVTYSAPPGADNTQKVVDALRKHPDRIPLPMCGPSCHQRSSLAILGHISAAPLVVDLPTPF